MAVVCEMKIVINHLIYRCLLKVLIHIFAKYCLQDIVSNICGFLVIVTAVILLNSFKENNVSCNMLRIKWNQKLETEYTTGAIDDLNVRPSNCRLHRHSTT